MNLSSSSTRRAAIRGFAALLALVTLGLLAPAAHAKRPSGQPNQSADVSVAVSDTPDPAMLSDEITYSVNVYNAGPGSTSVLLYAQLQGAGFTSVSSSQGTCTVNGSFNCPLGTIAARTSALVTIKVRPGRVGDVSIWVNASTDGSDPDYSNNSRTEHTDVWAAPVEAGCGGPFVSSGSCKFIATGGPITATAVYLENQFVLVCSPGIYCPLLYWDRDQYVVGVRLIDPAGRVVAECFSGGYCTTSSSEIIPAGTVLTGAAYDTSRHLGVGAYACTA